MFDIRLDDAQQAQYDAILLANGGAFNVFEGLSASFGCGANGPALCSTGFNHDSNDGAESFLAFQADGPPTVPEPSPLVLLITSFFILGLVAYRKNARLRFV